LHGENPPTPLTSLIPKITGYVCIHLYLYVYTQNNLYIHMYTHMHDCAPGEQHHYPCRGCGQVVPPAMNGKADYVRHLCFFINKLIHRSTKTELGSTRVHPRRQTFQTQSLPCMCIYIHLHEPLPPPLPCRRRGSAAQLQTLALRPACS